MKVLKEAKENLPIDFITSFISKGWEEVGNIKSSVEGIKKTFKNTKEIEDILQNLMDAYLITLGQLEAHLDDKKYVDIPNEHTISEALNESSILNNKFYSDAKAEVTTELPNYGVKVEQEDNDIDIEITPKNNLPEDDTTEYTGKAIFTSDELNTMNKENSTENCDFIVEFDDPDFNNDEESPYKEWMNKQNSNLL